MDTNAIEIIENPQHNEQSDSAIDHEPTLANANSTRKRALSVNSKEIARAVLNNLSCKYIGLRTIDVNNARHDCLMLIYQGGDRLYLLTNSNGAEDFKIVSVLEDELDQKNWGVFVKHQEGVLIQELHIFQNFSL